MKKYIIIDSENLTVDTLNNYFEDVSNYKFMGSFKNHLEADELIKSKKVDVVFISFSDRSSIIDYINTINDSFLPLFVVMSEDKDDVHKIRGTINIMDFLEKPISRDRIEVCLNIVNYGLDIRSCLTTDERLGKEFIFVKIDKKKVRIKIKDILFIESVKDYIKIITSTKKYLVYSTLTNFTKKLPNDKFMRVHRSYTIALDKVEAIYGNLLEIDGKKISYSKKYNEEIRSRLFIKE